MTWFRVGGGGSGVPASLKSRMNAVLNKKYKTLEVDYPPNEWPDDVDLLGLLEEKTASGVIANILDGADRVPTKNVIATIAATQTGVSSVNVTRIGKNLVDGTYLTRGLPSTTIGASIETITASNRYAYIDIDIGGTNFTISSVSNDTDYFWNILIYGYTNGILSVYTNTAVNTSKTVDFSACDFIRLAIGTQSASYQVPTDLTEYGTIQLEVGSEATTYQRYIAPTVYSADLGRTIYGGTADLVTGEGVDENGNDFTFTGQRIETMLGVNNFWNDAGGDTSVTYRSSGTMTPVTPTLITKTITANGTYQAADDQADGYSEVVVNVPQPTPAVDPIMSLNVFVSKSGVSGTNTSTVARSFTMSAAGTLIFASGSYGFTNTGSNDGYFEIQKNGVSVVKQYCNTSTNTPITIPNISVEENDVVDLVVGFDNAHSNCSFQFYSAMVVLSEV